MKLDDFGDVVESAWSAIDGNLDPFRWLVAKMKRTTRQLMS
jgi:hypothetical protein